MKTIDLATLTTVTGGALGRRIGADTTTFLNGTVQLGPDVAGNDSIFGRPLIKIPFGGRVAGKLFGSF